MKKFIATMIFKAQNVFQSNDPMPKDKYSPMSEGEQLDLYEKSVKSKINAASQASGNDAVDNVNEALACLTGQLLPREGFNKAMHALGDSRVTKKDLLDLCDKSAGVLDQAAGCHSVSSAQESLTRVKAFLNLSR